MFKPFGRSDRWFYFGSGCGYYQEKSQYKLHYYYQPTANAFTIKNSKDVFMFSQLLYEEIDIV